MNLFGFTSVVSLITFKLGLSGANESEAPDLASHPHLYRRGTLRELDGQDKKSLQTKNPYYSFFFGKIPLLESSAK